MWFIKNCGFPIEVKDSKIGVKKMEKNQNVLQVGNVLLAWVIVCEI